jgi:hypothetical protein
VTAASLALACVTLACATLACAKPAVPADEAATSLQRNLQLPDDPLRCMRDRFSDGDVAAVMDPETAPTAEQRARFASAARSCIPVDVFAGLLADSLVTPGAGEVPGDGTAECLSTTIGAMTTDEQDQLYVHFSNPAALDAEAVRDSSAQLIAACGLGDSDPSGTIVGPPEPPATTPTER